MATRFRKSINVAPGVKVNLNKGSASMTVGTKGAHVTKSTNGSTTRTVGIPGSGLSYVDRGGSRRTGSTSALDDDFDFFEYEEEDIDAPEHVFALSPIKMISGINEKIAKKITKIVVYNEEITFEEYDSTEVAKLQFSSIQGMKFYTKEVEGKLLKTKKEVNLFDLNYLTKKGNIKTVTMQVNDLAAFQTVLNAFKRLSMLKAQSEE